MKVTLSFSFLFPASLPPSLFLSLFFLSPLKVILALGDYMSVQCHACIGGTNVGEDIRKLDYGQHVVSGTPGRVFGESCCNPSCAPCAVAIKNSGLVCMNV